MFQILPTYRLVDTCAAEFEAYTPYYYSTYGDENEARDAGKKKIMILGGGPNRIGQGIEFDYCCVHASFALKELGYETIMVNSNPETVSTDYDTSDKLLFEPLTLEDVLNIYEQEKPEGVIVQFGGQTPLNLAGPLEMAGVPIIGTSPQNIELAEDRKFFAALLDKLGLNQAPSGTATNESEALDIARRIGYPVLVRPSFVLGGRAMRIVYDDAELANYMRTAVEASPDRPVLVDRFLDDATEVDVDLISDGETTVIGAIMEHIEQAGVHSGDSACVIPAFGLSEPMKDEIRTAAKALARELNVIGLMNIQFAVKDEHALRPRSESAGQPHRAIRVEGHWRPAAEARGEGHGRPPPPQAGRAGKRNRHAEETRLHRGNRADAFQREGSRLPVCQVSGHRHHPRPGNEEHRRSHGHRSRPRARLCEIPDGGRRRAADEGQCLH